MKPDVIGRNPNGTLVLHRGNGAGGWQSAVGAQIGNGWAVYNHVFSTGDFNGDSHPDLLGREPGGDLYLHRGDGAGAWQSGQRAQVGESWQSMAMIF